jgi:hypothetical protein
MVVVAFSMLFLALLMHVVAIQYARGVIRGALDEGLRLGSPAVATAADCMSGIDRVMNDLMAGPLGSGVILSCVEVGGQLTARAEATFSGWFPGVPDISYDLEMSAVKESSD